MKTLEERISDLTMSERQQLINWLLMNRPSVIREALRFIKPG